MFRVLAFTLLGSLLFSCGVEDEYEASPQLAKLVYKDSAGLEYKSYIVAFKNNLDGDGLRFKNFSEQRYRQQRALSLKHGHLLGLEKMTYLASLNMQDLGSSFSSQQRLSRFNFIKPSKDINGSEARLANIVKVDFQTTEDARSVLSYWKNTDQIYFADPNYKSKLSDSIYDRVSSEFSGDTTTAPWLNQIDYIEAIELIDGKELDTPIVAVLDSGLDIEHPDFQANLFKNTENKNVLCKDDLNGCDTTQSDKNYLGVGEVYPSSVKSYNTSCSGKCSHGTHVAGIIAAQPDSDKGYYGICPYCRVFPVKVVEYVDKNYTIPDSAIISAFSYVSGFKDGQNPAIRLINASFGKFDRSRSVELFINAMKNFGKGALVIAAAGNEDTMKRSYPAAFSNVIAVSNVNSDKDYPRKSPASNFGMWVDISAPGSEAGGGYSSGIRSSVPGGRSEKQPGTSMAAPVVTGVAGLALASEPELTATQLEERILKTAVASKLYEDGMNDFYRPIEDGIGLVPLLGSGVVNAFLAVQPDSVTTPPVVAVRPDSVTAGCGVIADGNGVGSFILLLPLVLLFIRKSLG